MKGGDKICHKVQIKSDKQLQAFKRRQDRNIEGVPRIILGKLQNGYQQIWVEQLKSQSFTRLKQLNNGQKAILYAKKIIQACIALINYYGYFIVNQNMVLFNNQKEVFVWINPDLIENHIKIYLPHNHDGELSMIRSIISYLKMWLKIDYSQLTDVKNLQDLIPRLDLCKNSFKAKSPQRNFLAQRRNSINLQSSQMPHRIKQQNFKTNGQGKQMLMDSKSVKDLCRSPMKQSQSAAKFNGMKYGNNQMTSQTQKPNFQHNTFNNNTNPNNKIQMNNSLGMKSGSYFPNKTTSNYKNSIVTLINKLDQNAQSYVKNKILLDDQQMQLQRAKIRKMKESLDGIGQQFHDLLFSSNIQNEEEDNQQKIKKMQQQFSDLLG